MKSAAHPPMHPYFVLVLAFLAPGAGHVATGLVGRGLGFALFSCVLGTLSWATTPPDRSFVGRAAFGLMVWAISIPDAYRTARVQYEIWNASEAKTRKR
jgi:hypothetical protein